MFNDGYHSSLSPVDIILFNRITLRQCNIDLQTYPTSLILVLARFCSSLTYTFKYWCLNNFFAGSCTDSSYTLQSLHCLQFFSVPNLESVTPLLHGNIRRVINTTLSGGRVAASPSAAITILFHGIVASQDMFNFFLILSVFISLGWFTRRPTISELF